MKKKISDLFARSMTKFFRFIADTFFAKRYGHRAVVLETVAGVCDGRTVTVESGSYEFEDVTGVQELTTIYADLTGSKIMIYIDSQKVISKGRTKIILSPERFK